MTTFELTRFLGFGLIAALVPTAAGIAASRLLGRAPAAAWWPVVFLTAFFVALTHHPFPDPATLDCTGGGQPARLVPFRFVGDVLAHWRQGVPLAGWVHDLTVASAAMNLLLCAAIGAALARCLPRVRQAALFGGALTLLVETSQITGIFGLYPCPYRQFDVDDMILNVAGVLIGHVLMRFSIGRASKREVERRTG